MATFTGIYRADFSATTLMDGQTGRRRDAVDGQVGGALGVPARPLRGDGLPPERRRPGGVEPGIRRRRRKLGGRRPRLRSVPQRSRRGLGRLHPGATTRRHPRRRVQRDQQRWLLGKGHRDLRPHREHRRQHPARPGRPATTGGVAGRSAARPLSPHAQLLERLPAAGSAVHRDHRLSSHRRSVHELLPRAVGLPTADIRRREVDLRHGSSTASVRPTPAPRS